jgi:hypothetical protein
MRERSLTREVLAFLLSTTVAVVSAMQMVGQTVRAVHVLSIFAGGIGVGASLASLKHRLRERRDARRQDAV